MPFQFWAKAALAVSILASGYYLVWPRVREEGLQRLVALRVIAGLALLGVAGTVATGIDRWGADGSTVRIVTVVGMMAAGFYGIILIASVIDIDASQGVFPLRPLRWIAGSLAGGLALIAVAAWLEGRTGFPPARTVLAALGAGIVVVSLLRPLWFWEHYKARSFRSSIGDRATIVIYCGIGVAISGMALFGFY